MRGEELANVTCAFLHSQLFPECTCPLAMVFNSLGHSFDMAPTNAPPLNLIKVSHKYLENYFLVLDEILLDFNRFMGS